MSDPLRYYKDQATHLDRHLNSADPGVAGEAARRVARHIPHLREKTLSAVRAAFRHGDALDVVAREQRFQGWREMAAAYRSGDFFGTGSDGVAPEPADDARLRQRSEYDQTRMAHSASVLRLLDRVHAALVRRGFDTTPCATEGEGEGEVRWVFSATHAEATLAVRLGVRITAEDGAPDAYFEVVRGEEKGGCIEYLSGSYPGADHARTLEPFFAHIERTIDGTLERALAELGIPEPAAPAKASWRPVVHVRHAGHDFKMLPISGETLSSEQAAIEKGIDLAVRCRVFEFFIEAPGADRPKRYDILDYAEALAHAPIPAGLSPGERAELGRAIIAYRLQEHWFECGQCGAYHPNWFGGDCREDRHRLPAYPEDRMGELGYPVPRDEHGRLWDSAVERPGIFGVG